MSSATQLAANRANAAHSTGPVTPDGKSRSSQNASTHGAFTRTVSPENQHQYETFLAGVVNDLAPATPAQRFLAERAASLMWRLTRLQTAADLAATTTDLPAAYADPDRDNPFDRLTRAEQRLHGMLNTTLRHLRTLQTDRPDHAAPKLQNKPNPLLNQSPSVPSVATSSPFVSPCFRGSSPASPKLQNEPNRKTAHALYHAATRAAGNLLPSLGRNARGETHVTPGSP
jgi:hypothetical protein